MKRTKELTMFLLAVCLFTACSNSDDEIIVDTLNSDDEIIVDTLVTDEVRGGVVYEGYLMNEVDESDPVSVFFSKELHSPHWDGYGNEFKTFFEQGEWNDVSCLVINSQQEFQAAYMGTKELPDVDFNKYTLVIGRTWGNDSSYKLDKIVLKDMGLTYELENHLLHHTNKVASAIIHRIYFWRLYHKLEQKEIILKRTVADVSE